MKAAAPLPSSSGQCEPSRVPVLAMTCREALSQSAQDFSQSSEVLGELRGVQMRTTEPVHLVVIGIDGGPRTLCDAGMFLPATWHSKRAGCANCLVIMDALLEAELAEVIANSELVVSERAWPSGDASDAVHRVSERHQRLRELFNRRLIARRDRTAT